MVKTVICALAAALALGATAAPAKGSAAKVKAPGFRRQAPKAAKALKVTSGKEFNAGLVFVCGKYIPPPYKVERYGTVIRINGIQVTDPLVAWEDFVKTQAGARQLTEADFADEEAKAAAAKAAPPANIDDITDLYEDGSEAAAAKPAEAESAVEEKPKEKEKNPLIGQWVFEGEFVRNDKAAELLDRINERRKEIDLALRGNGYIFFSPKYAPVIGEAGVAQQMLEKLPTVMKDNADAAAFKSAARSAGLGFLPDAVIADLYRNRVDYSMLMGRRRR